MRDPKGERMDSPQKKEYTYYLAHQEELVKQHNGKVVVIKGERVIGVYPDTVSAITETQRSEELGTFLVQKVEPGSDSYTQTFHSRVAFA